MANYIEVTSKKGPGAKIRAVSQGRVIDVGFRTGYGDHTVIVQYDDGPYVLYGYNRKARVKPWMRVYHGTVLAEMGCEGICREQHLGVRVHIKASNTYEGLFSGVGKLLDPREVFERINKNPPPDVAPFVPGQRGRPDKSSKTAKALGKFLETFRKAVGAPYKWGAGHGDGIGLKELIAEGADATGVFNAVRREIGLSNPEIGSFGEYFEFLVNVRPFDTSADDVVGRGKRYPIGTVLINPVDGHMAMIHTLDQKVLEAYGQRGISSSRTVYQANEGWEGFMYVGEMPDLGVYGPPPELEAMSTLGEGGRRMDIEAMKAQGREASGKVINDDLATTAGYLGPEHHNVQPHIKERSDKIAEKCGVYWNSYEGHTYRPGGREDLTVDFWDGYRGGDISDEQSQCVRDEILNNYCDDAMYMISDGYMYDTPEAGGRYHWSEDVEEGHYNHVHVTWGGDGMGETCTGGSGGGEAPGEEGAGGTSTSDPEPCIMRIPLGPYKLLWAHPGYNNSAMVRSAALYEGDFSQWEEFEPRVMDKEHGDGYDSMRSMIEEQIAAGGGTRDWIQLGELKKVPYMGTIQDVAASGMYSFNSVGSGEVVFWYPDLILELSDGILQQDPLTGRNESERREFFERLSDNAQVAYVQGLSKNQILERFPWMTDEEVTALMEAAAEREAAGEKSPFDRNYNTEEDTSNIDVLNQRLTLEDIELIDFHLYMSDEELVTHYFVMGDYRLEGKMAQDAISEIKCWVWSDIFHHPYFNNMAEAGSFDPATFIQRYGSRTQKEEAPAIKFPGMAQIWADNQLLKHWFNCYTVQLQLTYMPMLYPGMTIELATLGAIVQIMDVQIGYGTEWTTTVSAAIRGKTEGSNLPHVPFWDITPEDPDDDPNDEPPENEEDEEDDNDPRRRRRRRNRPGNTENMTPEELREDFQDRMREAMEAREEWMDRFGGGDGSLKEQLEALRAQREAAEGRGR